MSGVVTVAVVPTGIVTVAAVIGVTTVTVAATVGGNIDICGVDTAIVGNRSSEVEDDVESLLAAGVESPLTACVDPGAALVPGPSVVLA